MRQIDDALHEAYGYDLVVFAGFAATAEAQDYVAKGKLGKFDVAMTANGILAGGKLLMMLEFLKDPDPFESVLRTEFVVSLHPEDLGKKIIAVALIISIAGFQCDAQCLLGKDQA